MSATTARPAPMPILTSFRWISAWASCAWSRATDFARPTTSLALPTTPRFVWVADTSRPYRGLVAVKPRGAAGLDGLAPDVPDRPLGADRPAVGQHAQDCQRPADAALVEPGQAPPGHPRRGAVAERPGAPEPEPVGRPVAQRVDRRERQRGRVEVVARRQVELCVQVGPVGRQACGEGVPGLCEWQVVRLRSSAQMRGRSHLVRGDQLERAADALEVEAAE